MNEDFEAIMAEEEAIAYVQSMALRILREKNIKKSALAKRMGVSPAYVTQILTDSEPQNLSIKRVASLFYHLGEKLDFSCELIRKMDAVGHQRKIRNKAMSERKETFDVWCHANSDDTFSGLVAA
ncbi:helix-turn-helix domain-containing protein [Ponticaulis koreensis]|uniref:helix-turn-helix domain-containing protein n=1 Tax=Ponticaulis koreensis TaxID=1123045 RepID=UPI0003B6211F|nr:helix-turn-helix domain-containing protein [Ponticaulis koreensis]